MKKNILLLLILLLFVTACGKTVETPESDKKEEEPKQTQTEQKNEEPVEEKDQTLACSYVIDSDYYYMDRHYIFTFDSKGKKLNKIELTDSEKLTGDAELGESLSSELEEDCREINKTKGVTCKFSLSEKTATYSITYDLEKMDSSAKEEIDEVFDEIYNLSLEELKSEAVKNDMNCE